MIAFCITCKGRAHHVKVTLPQSIRNNPGPDSKFVLVDYNSQDDLVEYLRSEHMADIASGKLVVYSYRGDHPFKMAHAKNMAHRLGILEGADILCNLDADNFAGRGFEGYIAERFTDREIFMWTRVKASDESGNRLPQGANGRIICTARAFTNIGGYDERFETWGHDDRDFSARLKRSGFRDCEINWRFVDVIEHGKAERFREYPHARKGKPYEHDEAKIREALHSERDVRVVNFGIFGCGAVYRNFDPLDSCELRPIPTRIFGIGMHKTATTSLGHAFEILGYDYAHWLGPDWAKTVYLDMKFMGKSPTLERHYASCDLPLTLIFKELDAAYPRSKFILTTRDERGWLETVEKHWNPAFNPWRKKWDRDSFSHQVHALLYGQSTFDAKIFLERYRRHNAEVREYFKDRPADLLEMPMDEGAGWPELCRFLDRLVPAVPYPRSFANY